MTKDISIFSFFAGVFLDIGIEKAGFDIVFVNEFFEPFMHAYKYSRKKFKCKQPKNGYYVNDINDFLNEKSNLKKVMENAKNRIKDFIIGGIHRLHRTQVYYFLKMQK